MRKPIIGIMGPGGGATKKDNKNAYELGKAIASEGWILLTGGRNAGAMDEANRGAKSADGLTIGIIPFKDNSLTSEFVDVAIITCMGSARNNINVLSCDVVIACGIGAGTASEVALALKAGKNVILINDNQESKKFFQKLDKDHVFIAEDGKKVISIVKKLLQS